MAVSKREILDALKAVKEPELKQNIVDLGMVKAVEIAGPHARVTIALPTANLPMKDKLKNNVKETVKGIGGIEDVKVVVTPMTSEQRARILGQAPSEMEGMKGVKKVIAIASGKGGVGKTTVTVNLAIALSLQGHSVGILDADMHGPDIPIMLGIKERPVGSRGMLLPIEKYGLKIMSTGILAGQGDPIVWRGPLVNKAIKEFLGHVLWGNLDFLLVDLPPGTGDAPLTISTVVPLDGVLIVTTPQKVALADVRRSIGLFRGHDIPIIGIVENMSFLRLPGDPDGKVMDIFGSGGGEKIAKAFKLPLLGRIPLDPAIRSGGDTGRPVTLEANSEAVDVFKDIASRLVTYCSGPPAKGESS